jgi:hypothetical protein
MKCEIQIPFQVKENEDHYLQMSLTRSNNEFGHNTKKICNVKANVDDIKKLTYTHSIICDGGSHEQR